MAVTRETAIKELEARIRAENPQYSSVREMILPDNLITYAQLFGAGNVYYGAQLGYKYFELAIGATAGFEDFDDGTKAGATATGQLVISQKDGIYFKGELEGAVAVGAAFDGETVSPKIYAKNYSLGPVLDNEGNLIGGQGEIDFKALSINAGAIVEDGQIKELSLGVSKDYIPGYAILEPGGEISYHYDDNILQIFGDKNYYGDPGAYLIQAYNSNLSSLLDNGDTIDGKLEYLNSYRDMVKSGLPPHMAFATLVLSIVGDPTGEFDPRTASLQDAYDLALGKYDPEKNDNTPVNAELSEDEIIQQFSNSITQPIYETVTSKSVIISTETFPFLMKRNDLTEELLQFNPANSKIQNFRVDFLGTELSGLVLDVNNYNVRNPDGSIFSVTEKKITDGLNTYQVTYKAHNPNSLAPSNGVFEYEFIKRESPDGELTGIQRTTSFKKDGYVYQTIEHQEGLNGHVTLQQNVGRINEVGAYTLREGPSYVVPSSELLETLELAGGTAGELFGQYLSNDNVYQHVFYSALFKTLGTNLGTVAAYFLNETSAEGLLELFKGAKVQTPNAEIQLSDELLDSFVENLSNTASSALSGYILSEVGSALGLEGIAQYAFSTAGNSVVLPFANAGFDFVINGFETSVFENALNNFGSFDFSVANISSLAFSFASKELAGEIITPESEVAAYLGSFGSILGAKVLASSITSGITYLASTALGTTLTTVGGTIGSIIPGLGTAIGAFIGQITGTLIGNLFGDNDDPAAGATVYASRGDAQYHVGKLWAQDGGSVSVVQEMANAAMNGVNKIIEMTGGNFRRGFTEQVEIGYDGATYFVNSAHGSREFGNSGSAIKFAALTLLKNADIVGGNAIAMRAWHNSEATTLEQFQLDLSVADAFQTYLMNPTAILALMMNDPQSEAAQQWATILQRAAELELHLPHEKDIDGGWGEVLAARGDVNPEAIPDIQGNDLVLTDPITGEVITLKHVIGPGYEIIRTEGTDGNDTIQIIVDGPSITYTTAGPGDDNFIGHDGVDIFLGGAGDDVAYGRGGNDWLIGQDGNDELWGEAGDDLLSGGNGDDTLHGGAGVDTIYGGNGNDTIYGNSEIDYIDGGDGNDTIYGNSGKQDWLHGGRGDDIIYGNDYDHMYGGPGNDILRFQSGGNTVYIERGEGHDVLEAPNGNTLIFNISISFNELYYQRTGYDLKISILGENQSVTVKDFFKPGVNVQIKGANGHHALDGLGGYQQTAQKLVDFNKSISEKISGTYNILSDSALAQLSSLYQWENIVRKVTDAGNYSSTPDFKTSSSDITTYHNGDSWNRAFIFGGAGNDELRPDATNEWLTSFYIHGDTGDDKLTGANLADRIYGGLGNDKLVGGYGNDILYGGLGNDELHGQWHNDTIYGGLGNDIVYAGVGDDIAYGGEGDDKLYGSNGEDILKGDQGADKIYGENESDRLHGGDGNDLLEGGAGEDWLFGDNGNDTLNGGTGNDVLSGGDGDDILNGSAPVNPFFYQESKTYISLNKSDINGYAYAENIDIPKNKLTMNLNVRVESGTVLFSYFGPSDNSHIQLNNASTGFLVLYIAGVTYDTRYRLSAGQWHNLTLQWDGTTGVMNLYEGANKIYTGQGAAGRSLSEGGTLIFGQNQYTIDNGFVPGRGLKGDIADFTIWDRIISPQEMAQGPQYTDAVYRYNFSDGAGTVIKEAVQGSDATLLGNVGWGKDSNGNDQLDGGAGNDILNGNEGDDTLTGGEGSDTFIIDMDPGTADTITDFMPGVDKIDLRAFNGSFAYFQSLTQVSTQDGFATVIDLGNGQTLVLKNIRPQDLASTDFIGDVTKLNLAPVVQDSNMSVTSRNGNGFNVLGSASDPEGDPLSVKAISQATHGTVTFNANGMVHYAPQAGYTGADSFTYTVSDSYGNTDTARVLLNVSGTNTAPYARNDVIYTGANYERFVTLSAADFLANDTDADGDTLTITSISLVDGLGFPDGRSVALNSDGSIAVDFGSGGGQDFYVTYTIDDGFGGTDTATADIANSSAPSVFEENAQNDHAFTDVNTPVTIHVLDNDTDVTSEITEIETFFPEFDDDFDFLNDDFPIGPVEFYQTAGAVEINGNGTITYTPVQDFTGFEYFDYTVLTTEGFSSTARVYVAVGVQNGAPIAIDDTLVINEDQSIEIYPLNNDSDPENGNLKLIDVSPASKGFNYFEGYGNSIFYQPNRDFSGEDSFTYTVEDEFGLQATATVRITVNAFSGYAPVIRSDDLEVDKNQTLTIQISDLLANDVDLDGDSFSLHEISNVESGTLVNNGDGTLTFTPTLDPNALRLGGFTYSLIDETGAISEAPDSNNVRIFINDVTGDKFAQDDFIAVDEDTQVSFNVLSNDFDPTFEGSATARLDTLPSHGTVVLSANGDAIYTPDKDFFGTDSFTYGILDEFGDVVDIATVDITIESINDVPDAVDDVISLNKNSQKSFNVLDNDADIDGDTLSVNSVVQQASHGQITVTSNGFATYTPNANYVGTDSFRYSVTDDLGGTDTATVNITVNALINNAPNAQNDSFSVGEDVGIMDNVLDNDSDVDGDVLSAIAQTKLTSHGSVEIFENGDFLYLPNLNYNGADNFTYTVSDGNGGTDTATVNITINPMNDAPQIENNTGVRANEDQQVVITQAMLSAKDAETIKNALTFRLISQPSHGTLYMNGVALAAAALISQQAVINGQLTYKPDPNFNGQDSFKFTASDGALETLTQTFGISVNPVNDAPIANDDRGEVDQGGSVTINVLNNDGDIDGDTITVSIATGPQNGTARINSDGSITYTPNAGTRDTDRIIYVATDSKGAQDTAEIQIVIKGTNTDGGDSGTDEDPETPPTPVTTVFNGTNGADTISGTSGDDIINGLAGNDTLKGLAGNDTIKGGIGQDNLKGNGGDDVLKGQGGNDIIRGGGGNDELKGNAGDDVLRGQGGNDILYGQGGNDILLGLAGDDRLIGGVGHDILNGGAGRDTLTGGAGSDTFVFDRSTLGSIDRVEDFNRGQGDKIDIRNLLTGYDSNDDLITDFVRITQNGSNSALFINRDGHGNDFVKIAILQNTSGLTNEDLLERQGILITE